jgi:hypothetical protein
MNQPLKTVPQLLRDCLRLINHVAGKGSIKGQKLRTIVAGEFRKNAKVTSEEDIIALKGNAVRALSNYLMLESLSKDKGFKDKAASYNDRSLKSAEEEVATEKIMEAEYEEVKRSMEKK